MRTEEEMKIMDDFDAEKYEAAYCNRMNCHCCEGTDCNGEPNGYGCGGLEERIDIMYDSILKRRLKRMQYIKGV